MAVMVEPQIGRRVHQHRLGFDIHHLLGLVMAAGLLAAVLMLLMMIHQLLVLLMNLVM